MFFPSVIVCNINQIRKSFVRGLGLHEYDDIDLLYRQFYSGIERNLTSKEQDTISELATSEVMVLTKRISKIETLMFNIENITLMFITYFMIMQAMVTKLKAHQTMMIKSNNTDIEKIMQKFNWTSYLKRNKKYIETFDFIRDMAVEDPGDSPIISASYGGKGIPVNATDFLPFFGTDIGLCSIVKPQLSFDSKYDNLTYAQKLFGVDKISYARKIKPGAKVGKVNGLVLLLDAETFDYTINR